MNYNLSVKAQFFVMYKKKEVQTSIFANMLNGEQKKLEESW